MPALWSSRPAKTAKAATATVQAILGLLASTALLFVELFVEARGIVGWRELEIVGSSGCVDSRWRRGCAAVSVRLAHVN